jgi:hypothetical protein
MLKFIYDRYDFKRRKPYPNLFDKAIVSYYNQHSDEYNYDTNNQKFVLATCHSELYGNLINKSKNYIIAQDGVPNNDEKYFYPIEIFGNHRRLLDGNEFKNSNNVKYSTSFRTGVSQKVIDLARKGRIKFIINYSHEPFSDSWFLEEFGKVILNMGLSIDMFHFFVGTSNLYQLLPESKSYNFYFEDSIISSTAIKIKNLKSQPNFTLGYKTEWIDEFEIDNLRSKYFVCLNRNSQKPFRYTFGCFLEAKNMWDKVYASFLKKSDNRAIYLTGVEDFDSATKAAEESFMNKIPIEVDTQDSEDKESFEVARAFKKEIYLDSYIYIVTETNFENDIFLTEKICNPMAVLQPFIIFGAYGYLKYLQSLGFKTFDGFIDESYDDIKDNEKRYVKVCSEIERISNLPLEQLHSWYNSISDVMIHNRNHLLTFADKTMFKDNLEKIEKQWIKPTIKFL